MELSEARMLLGDASSPHGGDRPAVVEWNPIGDAARLGRLAEWCGRFAPAVGVANAAAAAGRDARAGRGRDAGGPSGPNGPSGMEPPGLLFDLGGCADLLEHRHAGGDPCLNEHRLAMEIEFSLDRLGFTAVAAVAGTVGLAWGLARHRSTMACPTMGISGDESDRSLPCDTAPWPRCDRIVRPGDELMVLEALPVECLRLDAETLNGLRQLHFERIADLTAIERPELGLRFGAMVPRRLAEALGEIEEMVVPVRPAPAIEVHREFATPVQARDGLELALAGMLEAFGDRLRREERGVERLHVEIERLDREPASLVLSLGRASRRVGHLWGLLAPRLEEFDLGLGVERIRLRALRVRKLPHRQGALTASHRTRDEEATSDCGLDGESRRSVDDAAASELADSIVSRFGAHTLRRPAPIEGHLPEACDRSRSEQAASDLAATPGGGTPDWTRSLRPTLLRRRPDPIGIERPDGDSDGLAKDRLDVGAVIIRWLGRSRPVIEAHGPERIAEPWWRRDDAVPGEAGLPRIREYWCCRLEGDLWVWVFREAISAGEPTARDADSRRPDVSGVSPRLDDRWFLHGIWA